MATDKTRSVSGRVPIEIAAAFEIDAQELGMKPGTLLRRLLEGRYSLPRRTGKTVTAAGKHDDLVELPDA